MRPFPFQFRHYPTGESFDPSLIEYDESLNLNIDKSTGKPAISELNLMTETFTRSDEAADSDNRGCELMMATATETKSSEDTDSDRFHIGTMMITVATPAVAHDFIDSDIKQVC